MLYPFEKEELQYLVHSEEFGLCSEKGTCLKKNDKTIQVPTFEVLFEASTALIKNIGYNVIRIYPRHANCFLRVFRNEAMKYNGKLYWTFGSDLYFLKNGSNNIQNLPHPDKTVICRRDGSNEIFFYPDFVDYFLNISHSGRKK